MRIGTFLIILMIALVCLGLAIADDFHAREALSKAEADLRAAQAEINRLTQEGEACQEKVKALMGKIDMLENQIDQLKTSHIWFSNQFPGGDGAAGSLVTAVAICLVGLAKKMLSKSNNNQPGDYILLTWEERRQIVQKRRRKGKIQ